ncbi:hypothetical protein J4G33_13870 [Actinotalea sp. BY-33]|uniref:YCII-related domain-containing protein n=1 Tax=Actinotalea soli TaxID=2819234 RepID=A0A939LR15_9CELL|nr:YciI family protein [Actinotalea soli]MBO1752896.1 hypothetical protein [Actinotalea soli]
MTTTPTPDHSTADEAAPATPSPSEYVVLLYADEAAWLAASPEEQAAVFSQHERFSTRCEERGHRITGGAELRPSSTARLVRRDAAGFPTVTDGPYAETVERFGGYYLVESSDVDDLAALVTELLEPGETAEIRATTNDVDGQGA